ncbi:MAG: hypothetical protein MJE12_29290 [Alphaproteobacteria bacterium]|nr:hypothetical protein [Alphaproteobacteria bacterium]
MFRYVVFLALLVSACADFEAYQHRLDAWIGHSAKDLVQRWRTPESVIPLQDGGQVLLYKTPVVVGMFCETRFIVDDTGVIRKWAYYGNDCGA